MRSSDFPGSIVPVSVSPLGPSTSSAWGILPSLLTAKVTVPALSMLGFAGEILNSVSETFTEALDGPVGAAASSSVVPVEPLSDASSSSPQAANAQGGGDRKAGNRKAEWAHTVLRGRLRLVIRTETGFGSMVSTRLGRRARWRLAALPGPALGAA